MATSLTMEDQEGHYNDITTYVDDRLNGDDATQGFKVDAMKDHLDEIPQDLNDLFKDMLARDSKDRHLTILILQCILFARRSMTPKELYIAVKSERRSLNIKHLSESTELTAFEKYILSCSKGLIEVLPSEDGTVQFIHDTVRNFLFKNDFLASMQADSSNNIVGLSRARLADCCLNFILANISFPRADPNFVRLWRDRNVKTALEKIAEDVSKIPFAEYSITNIFDHAEAAEAEETSQNTLLDSFHVSSTELKIWIVLHSAFEKHKVRRYIIDASLLYIACIKGLHCTVRLLFHNMQDVNVRGERCGNSLQAACVHGHLDIVRTLIEFGADVNAVGGQHFCALAAAVHRNKISIAQHLIDAQAAVNAKVQGGRSLLAIAAKKGSKDVLKLLIGHGADVDAVDKYGDTPLVWAAEHGYLDTIQLLVGFGANLQARSADGDLLITKASESQRPLESCELLLQCGVDLEAIDKRYGRTALFPACVDRRVEVVRMLLRRGANVQAMSRFEGTPLFWMVSDSPSSEYPPEMRLEIVELLL